MALANMTNVGLDPVIHLLLVDSDPETVSVVQQSLCSYRGAQLVGVATTGSQAFELAVDLQPDVIVMDPDLPDSDGLFLLPQVMWPVEPKVMIISADVRYAFSGARGFLPKPVRAEDLLAALDDALYSPDTECVLGHRRPPPDQWEPLRLRVRQIVAPLLRGWTRAYRAETEAEAAARELLLTHLTDEEQQQLATQGYLEVQSVSRVERRYRIPAAGGMVRMLEHGRVTLLLCLQPTASLPRSDEVLMHKLLLQADEEAYLQTANHFTPSGQYLRRRRLYGQP
ncbi:MAG: response regulator transcription factor [Ktedonobacterales bacterium]